MPALRNAQRFYQIVRDRTFFESIHAERGQTSQVPRAKARPVLLPEQVREELERTVRQHTAPQRDVLRARIALMADEGSSNAEIQRELGCHIKTVRKWRAAGRRARQPT